MNTQVTRPGHMLPLWKQGERQPYGGHVWYGPRDAFGGWGDLMEEDTPAEIAREARVARMLERVQWFAGGLCVGCFALWASITF